MRNAVVFRLGPVLAVLALSVLPAACAGTSGTPSAGSVPAASLPASSNARSVIAAPPQSNETRGVTGDASGTKSKTEPIKPGGGKFSLPKLPSLKGELGYPGSDAAAGAKAVFEVSLTNVFDAPTPPSTTIVYFASATLDSSQSEITFDQGKEKAKIVGSLLDPSKSYTIYIYIPALSNEPVDTIPLGNPNAQHELVFDSPFSGATLPTNTVAYLELGAN